MAQARSGPSTSGTFLRRGSLRMSSPRGLSDLPDPGRWRVKTATMPVIEDRGQGRSGGFGEELIGMARTMSSRTSSRCRSDLVALRTFGAGRSPTASGAWPDRLPWRASRWTCPGDLFTHGTVRRSWLLSLDSGSSRRSPARSSPTARGCPAWKSDLGRTRSRSGHGRMPGRGEGPFSWRRRGRREPVRQDRGSTRPGRRDRQRQVGEQGQRIDFLRLLQGRRAASSCWSMHAAMRSSSIHAVAIRVRACRPASRTDSSPRWSWSPLSTRSEAGMPRAAGFTISARRNTSRYRFGGRSRITPFPNAQ